MDLALHFAQMEEAIWVVLFPVAVILVMAVTGMFGSFRDSGRS